jgi:hypothetical protein
VRLARAIDWLLGWTADLARVAAGGTPRQNPDFAPHLQRLAERASPIPLFRYHEGLLQQRALLAHPVAASPRRRSGVDRLSGDIPMILRTRWSVAVLFGLIVAGCATPPPAPPPAPPQEPVREPPPPPPPVPCNCDEPNREIARLRQDLANKDIEIRELRAQHRDQVKALQESAKRAARANVKLHRFATQAGAASYIAEVEVALQTLRGTPDAGSRTSLIAVAEGMLQSATAAFARGRLRRGDESCRTGATAHHHARRPPPPTDVEITDDG